jgi:hypothetical protein
LGAGIEFHAPLDKRKAHGLSAVGLFWWVLSDSNTRPTD